MLKHFFKKNKQPPLAFELSSNELMVTIADQQYSKLASFLLSISKPTRAITIAAQLEELEALNCPFKIANKTNGVQLILSNKECLLTMIDKSKMNIKKHYLSAEATIEVLWSWSNLVQKMNDRHPSSLA